MKSIAIITARGGSKRIPRKNVKEFCGKPILLYSIEAALESKIFDEVMVSTDDKEIAEIALAAGARVPFMRSADASNDFATTADVLKEVLKDYENMGETFEYLACLYPTAPFVTAEKLKNAYGVIREENGDWAVPVVQYGFPPQRAMVIKDKCLKYQYPECRTARSQDLEPIYHDCGQFYFYKVDALLSKDPEEWKVLPLIMKEEETQDIDNESDWIMAELKYQLMTGGNK